MNRVELGDCLVSADSWMDGGVAHTGRKHRRKKKSVGSLILDLSSPWGPLEEKLSRDVPVWIS